MNTIHNNSSNCGFQQKYRNLLRKIINNNKYGNKRIEIFAYRNKIKKIKNNINANVDTLDWQNEKSLLHALPKLPFHDAFGEFWSEVCNKDEFY